MGAVAERVHVKTRCILRARTCHLYDRCVKVALHLVTANSSEKRTRSRRFYCCHRSATFGRRNVTTRVLRALCRTGIIKPCDLRGIAFFLWPGAMVALLGGFLRGFRSCSAPRALLSPSSQFRKPDRFLSGNIAFWARII